MSSSTTAHLANGSPWTLDGGKPDVTEVSPGLYYGLSMGGADVNVDVTLSSGRRITIKGRGGFTRLWAIDGWLEGIPSLGGTVLNRVLGRDGSHG